MTPRAEAVSIAVAAFGMAVVVAALYLAFPPFVALGFAGLVLIFGAIGAESLWRLFRYGFEGVEEKRREGEEERPA